MDIVCCWMFQASIAAHKSNYMCDALCDNPNGLTCFMLRMCVIQTNFVKLWIHCCCLALLSTDFVRFGMVLFGLCSAHAVPTKIKREHNKFRFYLKPLLLYACFKHWCTSFIADKSYLYSFALYSERTQHLKVLHAKWAPCSILITEISFKNHYWSNDVEQEEI